MKMFNKLFLQSIHRSKLFALVKHGSRGTLHRLERNLSNQNRRSQPGFKMGGIAERGYALLVVPVLTFCLGMWQLQRKEWKENMIRLLEEVVVSDPVPLPDDLEELKNMDLQPVVVTGEFDYAHETYLGPKSYTHADSTHTASKRGGVHVITPFKVANRNLTIMINRGWLDSSDWEKEETRKKAQVHGPRSVVGVVRLEQDRHWAVRLFVDTTKISEKKGLRYFTHRHLDLLAKECHAAPVYLDALEDQMQPGAPLGVRPARDLRNEHLQYAITWFGVALVSFYFWAQRFGRPLNPAAIRRTLEKREAVRNNRKK